MCACCGGGVINQIPKKCGSKSSRTPAQLHFKCAPPSHWELEDLEAHRSSICLRAAESHAEFRQQSAQQLKERLTCFISLMG